MIWVGDGALSLEEIARVANGQDDAELSPGAIQRMARSRASVERILARGAVVYGVNTGFGRLCDIAIPQDQLQTLQRNLVRSHACGTGRPLDESETRGLLLLRANALGLGFSGARAAVAELIVAMLATDVLPVIPEKGSVGASGDLAPLAHLALVLIGEGEAFLNGERMAGGEALRRAGLVPLTLEAKEGLAILNGTQAMNSVGGLALWRGLRGLACGAHCECDESGSAAGNAGGFR